MAGKKKKEEAAQLLTDRQRRDLLGLALALLALFTALSLVPPRALGLEPGAARNLMGVVGATFEYGGRVFLGAGVWLVPLLPALGALAAFGLRPSLSLRWMLLTLVIALLLPISIGILAAESAVGAGVWGASISGPLVAGLGVAGATMLVAFAAIAASILTIGWNPVRTAAGGTSRGARALRGAMGTVDPAAVSGPFRRLLSSARARREAATDDVGLLPPEPDVAPRGPGVADAASSKRTKGGTSGGKRGSESAGATPFEGPIHAGPAGASPPLPLLHEKPPRDPALTTRELDRLGGVLVETLATFRVEGEIIGRTTGPVVTQYEFAPAPGIKVSRVEALDADLALALKAPSVRIVAPIPGKAAVGVEVPNPEPDVVYLREIVEAAGFQRHRGQLPLALGKDLEGRPYVADLAKMPHLLIAGATGSGKSVCINTIITSLVYRHSPETLRLLLVDPKMVELEHVRRPAAPPPPRRHRPRGRRPRAPLGRLREWNDATSCCPRTACAPSPSSTPAWTRERRSAAPSPTARRVIQTAGSGTTASCPTWSWWWTSSPTSMMSVQSDIERPLAQLAQKARAIGIHLIVATQRPSVNVITGLIKANFPCRIGFRVSSKVDSRTILDQNGADALLGNGDMLFLPPGTSDPVRVQGAFVSTEETERLMGWYREQEELRSDRPERDILEVVREKDQEAAGNVADEVLEEWDELFRQAAEVCIQHEQGSTSLLQRRLRVGYGRAARIVDQLEHAGIIGPPDGSKPRDVLVGMDGLDLLIAGHSEGPEHHREEEDQPEPLEPAEG